MSSYLAPPVCYPVGPSRKAAVLAGSLWGVAAAVQLAWWQLSAAGDLGPLLGGLSLLAVGVLLLLQHARPVHGQILWNGHWQWSSPAYPAGTVLSWPQVVVDGQQLMLVHLRNADGARWLLWLDADAQPQDWWDLRRALLARPAAPDPDGANRAG
jgi:hypothetical protein